MSREAMSLEATSLGTWKGGYLVFFAAKLAANRR